MVWIFLLAALVLATMMMFALGQTRLHRIPGREPPEERPAIQPGVNTAPGSVPSLS